MQRSFPCFAVLAIGGTLPITELYIVSIRCAWMSNKNCTRVSDHIGHTLYWLWGHTIKTAPSLCVVKWGLPVDLGPYCKLWCCELEWGICGLFQMSCFLKKVSQGLKSGLICTALLKQVLASKKGQITMLIPHSRIWTYLLWANPPPYILLLASSHGAVQRYCSQSLPFYLLLHNLFGLTHVAYPGYIWLLLRLR